jgi:hypothetical protein
MSAVDKQLVKELEHRDVRRRKQAVEKLGAANDPVAIKILMAVSRQDADPAVREMALKTAKTSNAQMVETLIAEKEKAKSSNRLSPADKEAFKRAKATSEEAFTWHTNGNHENALKTLTKAIMVYPGIREDSYFLNILQAVTGEDGEAGLAMLPAPTRSFFSSLFRK